MGSSVSKYGGCFALPSDEMEKCSLDCINIGFAGFAAHRRTYIFWGQLSSHRKRGRLVVGLNLYGAADLSRAREDRKHTRVRRKVAGALPVAAACRHRRYEKCVAWGYRSAVAPN